MIEIVFALIGAWLYLLLLFLIEPLIGPGWGAFLVGYMLVAVVDLWRCWRRTPWRRVRATAVELAVGALLLFPLGSLLWLPWDLQRFYKEHHPC